MCVLKGGGFSVGRGLMCWEGVSVLCELRGGALVLCVLGGEGLQCCVF